LCIIHLLGITNLRKYKIHRLIKKRENRTNNSGQSYSLQDSLSDRSRKDNKNSLAGDKSPREYKQFFVVVVGNGDVKLKNVNLLARGVAQS